MKILHFIMETSLRKQIVVQKGIQANADERWRGGKGGGSGKWIGWHILLPPGLYQVSWNLENHLGSSDDNLIYLHKYLHSDQFFLAQSIWRQW